MPRKGPASSRRAKPDPKYNDIVVAKFINAIMYGGKKSKAEEIVYGALDIIGEKTGHDPFDVFIKAMENVKPGVEVRSRRVGGATYQVPVEVSHFRRQSLGIRWLINSARRAPGKSMAQKLAAELTEASQGRGPSIKRREDTYRMAEANRAFAHYRW
ncbi:MAG: 30S ribosomal protein S7 [Candidatus Dadabacteria bacterium]|nr:30S ribosomal protein S7 [Candidatus Dadabacteria bacterium]